MPDEASVCIRTRPRHLQHRTRRREACRAVSASAHALRERQSHIGRGCERWDRERREQGEEREEGGVRERDIEIGIERGT